MYKNILVPVEPDHSGRGDTALSVARALMDPGARVTLLHVMAPVPGFIAGQLPAGTMEKNREIVLEAMREMAEASKIDVEIKISSGHPSTLITEFAEDHGVDCIVIASHKPGLEDYLLGSTAARVVRHAPCAVHVLR